MAYRNRFDKNGDSQQMGENAENEFFKIATSKKLKIEKLEMIQ